MKEQPRVTVLTTVYIQDDAPEAPALKYLKLAVESVLRQTFTDFEHIVVNDGSSEQTARVLARYNDSRLRVINKPHRGRSPALNCGLEEARGELVAIMDADDISLPHRLELQVSLLEAQPKLDLIFGHYQTIDDSGKVLETVFCPVNPLYRLWRLQFSNVVGHGSVIFRKSAVLEAGKYDERLGAAVDYDLLLRMCQPDNNQVVPRPLYQYRMSQKIPQITRLLYEVQCTTAHSISNERLRKFDHDLTNPLCRGMRFLYWRPEPEFPTRAAIAAFPKALAGFCGFFGLSEKEHEKLTSLVIKDIVDLGVAMWHARKKQFLPLFTQGFASFGSTFAIEVLRRLRAGKSST